MLSMSRLAKPCWRSANLPIGMRRQFSKSSATRPALRTSVPTYSKVQLDDVYPGVDLVYYGNQRQLEYDFVVHPGAAPSLINFHFTGADRVTTDDDGRLVIQTGRDTVKWHAPMAFQVKQGAGN